MAGGGKEANYWPGFVDALSNVVVVMVFVLVVFTIGLIHFSQNKAKEIVAQAALEQIQGGQPDEKSQVARSFVSDLLASKIEALMQENAQLREAAGQANGPAAGAQAGQPPLAAAAKAAATKTSKAAQAVAGPTPDPSQAEDAARKPAQSQAENAGPTPGGSPASATVPASADAAAQVAGLIAPAGAPSPSQETVRSEALARLAEIVRENNALREAISEAAQRNLAAGKSDRTDPKLARQLDALKNALDEAKKRAEHAEKQVASKAEALERERVARQVAETRAAAAAEAASQAAAQASADAESQSSSTAKSVAAARARAYSAKAANEQREGGGVPSLMQAGAIARAEVSAEEVASEEGDKVARAEIRGSQAALAITFPGGTYLISDKTRELLDVAFGKIGARASVNGVTLVASPEVGSYSEGRRLSYYRNLEIRNWLIAKGVPAEKIRMRIAERNSGADRGVIQLSVDRD